MVSEPSNERFTIRQSDANIDIMFQTEEKVFPKRYTAPYSPFCLQEFAVGSYVSRPLQQMDTERVCYWYNVARKLFWLHNDKPVHVSILNSAAKMYADIEHELIYRGSDCLEIPF